MSPDPHTFNLAQVESALQRTRFAGKLHHFSSIESTNVHAVAAAQGGAPDGSVYVADQQTAGRGRGGHSWHSATGDGLYVSILVRPRLELQQALWISLATGLAVQSAIASLTGLTPDIRWPNDQLLGGRKCAGILVETAAAGSTAPAGLESALRFAVIGIGINVNHAAFPRELASLATSLHLESDRTWQREDLLLALLPALAAEMDELEAHTPGLLERFAAASTWVRGKRVRVDEAGGYTGVTAGLDAAGFLRVMGEDGLTRTVLSGGVRTL